jgi:3',5'-cyclic-nucleotide phosphodiesterase
LKVELRIIGCHGGETPRHRPSAFLLDDRIALDAGSLTSGMDFAAQDALEACLVSHAHLDHIRDLATIADNRCQRGCPPLVIAGTKETLRLLRKHFFNGLLWPDFTKIPSPSHPTIEYRVLKPEVVATIAGYRVRAIEVSHTIECCAFVVQGPDGAAIAYSGDTGPTERLWEVLSEVDDLRAMLMEVSFPNREQPLATLSGHHTPRTLAAELKKYKKNAQLPFLLYHIKPVFQAEVEKECAKITGQNLTIPKIGDQFIV